jgi:hypothetical protein
MAKRYATECVDILDVCRKLQLLIEQKYAKAWELIVRIVSILVKTALAEKLIGKGRAEAQDGKRNILISTIAINLIRLWEIKHQLSLILKKQIERTLPLACKRAYEYALIYFSRLRATTNPRKTLKPPVCPIGALAGLRN